MKGNVTLNLWNIAATPAAFVHRGSVLTIGGVECAFLGCGLDHTAYFWLGPGNARYMSNDELWAFGLAVISEMQSVSSYVKAKRDGKS